MKVKSLYLVAPLVACLAITGCGKDKEAKINVSDKSSEAEKVGYSLGYMMAKENRKSVKDLDIDTFSQGFQDGYGEKKGALTDEQMQKILIEYQKKRQKEMIEEAKAMLKKNKEAGDKFLAENKKKDGVKTTASGLQYKVIKAGKGASPKSTDIVEVNYEGKLIDGKVFDSSYERKQSVKFPLNEVIKGWTEGVQLMNKGAEFEFYIPANLAYGEQGNPNIEPNSVLIFKVELIDFKPAK